MSAGSQDFYNCGCWIFTCDSTSTLFRCQNHMHFKPRLLEKKSQSYPHAKDVGLELVRVPASNFGNTAVARAGTHFYTPKVQAQNQAMSSGPSHGFWGSVSDMPSDAEQYGGNNRGVELSEFVMSGGNGEGIQVDQPQGYAMNNRGAQDNNGGYVGDMISHGMQANNPGTGSNGGHHIQDNCFGMGFKMTVEGLPVDDSESRFHEGEAMQSFRMNGQSIQRNQFEAKDGFSNHQLMPYNHNLGNIPDNSLPTQADSILGDMDDDSSNFPQSSPPTRRPQHRKDFQSNINDVSAPFPPALMTTAHNTAPLQPHSTKQAILNAMQTSIQNGLAEVSSLRDIDINCERANVKHWIQDIRAGRSTLDDMEMGLWLSGEGKDLGRAMNAEKMRERILRKCMETLNEHL